MSQMTVKVENDALGLPRVLKFDVPSDVVRKARKAGLMGGYIVDARVQYCANIARVMGYTPRTEDALRAFTRGKRGIANDGFTLTMWVES